MTAGRGFARAAAVAATLAATLAGSVGVTSAAPAAAEQAYARQDTFALSGHGWGHGRGMSQQGAHGAAITGLTATQIVDFYYPGTTLTTVADSGIRVLLSGDVGLTQTPSTSLDVSPASGLTVEDVATGRLLVLPSGPDRWRVVREPAGTLVLQGRRSGTWTAQALPGAPGAANAGPLVLRSTPGVLRRWYALDKARDYRGELRAVSTGTGLAVVGHLPMEQYLRAVVPAEMPASWHPEALGAQSIAARSYSSWKREDSRTRLPSQPWDICDSTRCQVYGGLQAEAATTDAAIDATSRQLLVYGAKPVFAEFSASNGGWTVAGAPAYQVARRDPYDGVTGSASHSWTALLPAAALEKRFPALGRLVRLRVVTRDGNGDGGGRVEQVVLEGRSSTGAATSVTTTGREVYLASSWPSAARGLRSNWWTVTSTAASDPFGAFDSLTTGPFGERVRGWALDPDTTAPVQVEVRVDGRSVLTTAAANERPDVGRLHPDNGSAHGFDIPLSLADGSRQVCVYALNAAGTAGSSKLVGCRSVTVRHTPFGAFDSAVKDGSDVIVRGWAADPDTAASIKVHVHVDGRVATRVVADRSRPDIGRLYPTLGASHGFGVRVPTTAGRHTVCTYAINAVGTPGGNAPLGCRTVTI